MCLDAVVLHGDFWVTGRSLGSVSGRRAHVFVPKPAATWPRGPSITVPMDAAQGARG